MIDKIKLENGLNIKVDKGNITGVSCYELADHLEDLFKFKRSYHKDEIIKLSNICDAMFDLMFCGKNTKTKEIVFKLC